jgi:hypothetical protein
MAAVRDLQDLGEPDRIRIRTVAGYKDEAILESSLRIRRSRPPTDHREHGREQRISFVLDRFQKFQIVGRRVSHKILDHNSDSSVTTRAERGRSLGRGSARLPIF